MSKYGENIVYLWGERLSFCTATSLETAEETTEMRRAAGRLGWLGRGTRPDLLFNQIEISTKFVTGVVGDLMLASKALRKIKSQSSFLLIRDLGKVTDWSIEISTDASFKNLNDGLHSTAAGVILIKNNNNIANGEEGTGGVSQAEIFKNTDQ